MNWLYRPGKSYGPLEFGSNIADLPEELGKPSHEKKGLNPFGEEDSNVIIQVYEIDSETIEVIFHNLELVEIAVSVAPMKIELDGKILEGDGNSASEWFHRLAQADFFRGNGESTSVALSCKWRKTDGKLVLCSGSYLPVNLAAYMPIEIEEPKITEKEYKIRLGKILKEYPKKALLCWRAEISKVGTKSLSHYGGQPVLPDGKQPECQACGKPMILLLQLDLNTLPREAPFHGSKSGLFQFFHCKNENCIDLLGEEGDKGFPYLARVVAFPRKTLKSETKDVLKAKAISGWKRKKDAPQLYDLKEFPKLDSEFKDRYDKDFPEVDDKIFGWPAWIQEPDRPHCERCRSHGNMSFILQINSHDQLEFQWGDNGCAFLFQCRKHPEIFRMIAQTH